MKTLVACVLGALALGCDRPAPPASPAGAPAVELVRGGKAVALDAAEERALVERVTQAMRACNFSSEARPEIFGQDLSELWKQREAGSHLRLRHASDQSLDAVFGKLVYRELLLSIEQPYGPEPALARTSKGIVGLKKCGYDDRFLGCSPELARVFPPPPACPPGF